ncbi:MAG: family 43 glycosylhydrolase [Gorillibacterium sp.]|nr:family 43 glycosylhydrolase [Gorillibacterium sp.]
MFWSKKISEPIWSIKVYHADSPVMELQDEQDLYTPTVQAADVTDIAAEFVADPFVIHHDAQYYLFYEVLNKTSGRGDIGLSTSQDGVSWHYEQIVLTESFHLSYPQVFQVDGQFYMLPESVEANKVLLYKATHFPTEWAVVGELIKGRYTDPSLFSYKGKWWMYAGSKSKHLHLFYADELEGEWKEHPHSPIISDNRSISRPGGRVLVHNEQVYRYTQDGDPFYGSATRVIHVSVLTENDYAEEEGNLVLMGTGKAHDWKKDGMHHIDQLKLADQRWMIVVDGHHYVEHNYILWRLKRFIATWHRNTE